MKTDHLCRRQAHRGPGPGTPLDVWARLGTRRKRMVLYVAAYRAAQGRGPTWREAGRAVGSEHRSKDWVLVTACGPALTYRVEEPRSLDVARELVPILAPILQSARARRASSSTTKESTDAH